MNLAALFPLVFTIYSLPIPDNGVAISTGISGLIGCWFGPIGCAVGTGVGFSSAKAGNKWAEHMASPSSQQTIDEERGVYKKTGLLNERDKLDLGSNAISTMSGAAFGALAGPIGLGAAIGAVSGVGITQGIQSIVHSIEKKEVRKQAEKEFYDQQWNDYLKDKDAYDRAHGIVPLNTPEGNAAPDVLKSLFVLVPSNSIGQNNAVVRDSSNQPKYFNAVGAQVTVANAQQSSQAFYVMVPYLSAVQSRINVVLVAPNKPLLFNAQGQRVA